MKRFVKCFFELLTQALVSAAGNGAGFFYPVPRFRRRNGNGKNPDGQGFKSGDFFAHFVKKYYSSLDRLDSRNGRRTGIVFRNWVWYNFLQYKLINRNLEGVLSMIHTERINVVPFKMEYLLDYYYGFNHEITKFQWPDPFDSSDNAKEMLQEFLNEMERDETLLFSILSKDDAFLGSVEVHGLNEECPELGVWIIESEQNKGYAYEALKEVLNYVSTKYGKLSFFYEADTRNIASTKLLHKFENQYEIIEQRFEKLTTDSGKALELQGYILKAKKAVH